MWSKIITLVLLVIILSLISFTKNKENFSFNINDPYILKEIETENKNLRKKEQTDFLKEIELNKYTTINGMNKKIKEYTDKMISLKEILNRDLPVCRDIDLDPNIDYTSDLLTRKDGRFENIDKYQLFSDPSIQKRRDRRRPDENGNDVNGACSSYNNMKTDEKEYKCFNDKYCYGEGKGDNYKCKYKGINFNCYDFNKATGAITPKTAYLNPSAAEKLNKI